MFIAIASKLLAATHISMMLWTLAVGEQFTEVRSCEPYEEKNIPCISIYPVRSLGEQFVGKTWRWQNQYTILVIDDNPTVIAHELGHVVIGMSYHATPNTSIMSPAINNSKCLTDEDAHAYEVRYGKKLRLWCLP